MQFANDLNNNQQREGEDRSIADQQQHILEQIAKEKQEMLLEQT